MIAHADLQVWLETQANTRPPLIAPYVRSSQNKRIHYNLQAVRKGPSGTSNVSQSGTVNVLAQVPTRLSEMSISAGKEDSCRIELILAEGGVPVGTYHFDCPR